MTFGRAQARKTWGHDASAKTFVFDMEPAEAAVLAVLLHAAVQEHYSWDRRRTGAKAAPAARTATRRGSHYASSAWAVATIRMAFV